MSSINIINKGITDVPAECVVNAANDKLFRGSGVCNAIFKAAGSKDLEKECRKIGHCDLGSAVITPGFKLAKYIIHAVGPVYTGDIKESRELYDAYFSALKLAKENDIHSIVFPLISAGIYGYPKEEAFQIASKACRNFINLYAFYDVEINFAIPDKDIYDMATKILGKTVSNQKKSNLMAVFNNTIQMIQDNERLTESVKKSIENTQVHSPGYYANFRKVKNNNYKIEVAEDTTFHYASKYRGNRVAVLNFANAMYPGGGILHGNISQEECLCRSSTLYPCLDTQENNESYYGLHQKNGGHVYTDTVIYTPGITVFKDDEVYANTLSEDEWFNVDVITCAAPRFYTAEEATFDTVRSIHVARGRNILEVAIGNNVDILVLGAFGCGAFHNPPKAVASAYYKLLVEDGYAKYFDKVIFAIKKDHNDQGNFEAFRDTFADNQVIDEPASLKEVTLFYHEGDENGCFSQWYKCHFTVEGINYSSCEQYMMSKKALLFNDITMYYDILQTEDPAKCKEMGHLIRGFDQNTWDNAKNEIIFNGNYAKFSQNYELRDKLIKTKDNLLAEASVKDRIYGIGLAIDDKDAKDPSKWNGQNRLGFTLMKVRRQLLVDDNIMSDDDLIK